MTNIYVSQVAVTRACGHRVAIILLAVGQFTKSLILWNDIRCISSPTNDQCDAYWTEDPT